MDDLTPQQYQTVLTFMQTTNEDSFQTAAQLLRSADFHIEAAMALAQERRHPQNNLAHRRKDEEFIRRYGRYLQQKEDEWSIFGWLFGGIRHAFSFCFRMLAKILLPRYLMLKWLYSPFYRLYANSLLLPFKESSLKQLLLSTRNFTSNSVLLAVSTHNRDQVLVDLLDREEIKAVISRNYLFKGAMVGDRELGLVEGAGEGPQIVVCRMNALEEVVVVARFAGEELRELTAATLIDTYKRGRKLCRTDRNNLAKFYNWLNRNNKDYEPNPEESESEEIDPALPRLQRITTTEQIKQQNEVYHQLEEEQLRRQAARAEKEQQLREVEEIRQIRKLSLPAEPVEGDIVRVSFRCPDGNTLVRSFSAEEKVELLFDWVELNDEVVFEDPQRKFELMYSYPPKPLSPFKHQLLSHTFDTSHEKLLIRQL